VANRTDSSSTNATAKNTTDNNNDGEAPLLLVGKRSGILVCLQAAPQQTHPNLRREEAEEASSYAHRAYQCILRAHTPHLGVAVLDLFNPHLALLALCCHQCLICLGRFEYRRAQKNAAGEAASAFRRIPLWASGLVLLLLLISACAVQVVHAPELLQYPTVVFLLLWCALGGFYALTHAPDDPEDAAWELAFQLQTVAVPLALLAYAAFGPRLWADLVAHACLLSAAVNLLWLQLHQGTPVWLARLLVVGLTALSLHGALLQFGPFDTWRYAVTLMACLGLVPLLLLSLTGADPVSAGLQQRYHSLSLMASNAALVCLVVCLSRMV
jgi:hypothetical protein